MFFQALLGWPSYTIEGFKFTLSWNSIWLTAFSHFKTSFSSPQRIHGLKIQRVPPLVTKIFFVMNMCNMGIISSGLVSRFQNCWKFCSSMSTAWEIIKKPSKMARFCSKALFWQFFHDFSGCIHARAKNLTALESAQLASSFHTNKPYFCDKKFQP